MPTLKNILFLIIIYYLVLLLGGIDNYQEVTWIELGQLFRKNSINNIDIYESINLAVINCSGYHFINIQNSNNTNLEYFNKCYSIKEVFNFNRKLYISNYNNFAEKIETKFSTDISYSYKYTLTDWIFYYGRILLAIILLTSFSSIICSNGSTSLAGKITESPGKFIRRDKLKTKFTDVIGLSETKKELYQYIDYLKDRNKYRDFGISIPRGLLFLGPPGCGKTMLAKAIAREAGVNFIQVSGSDFQEMFVGVGAARVRHLFKMARDNKPCILFIDEIDSLGRKRDNSSYNSEANSVLNRFLVEMDGFEDNENILVIGATNRKKVLDSALLRSGRFDRKLVFDTPNIDERLELYKHYLSNKPNDITITDNSLKKISKRSAGLTGSDINTICNQAAIICLRTDKTSKKDNVKKNNKSEKNRLVKPLIKPIHLFQALEEIAIGNIKRERLLSDTEKNRVAFHEAGHCLVSYLLEGISSPIQVSIIPRGEHALGYSMNEPEDKKLYLENELLARIVVLLGGRVAEDIVLGTISTGAADDLERASDLAYDMVTRYGFSNNLLSHTERIGDFSQEKSKSLKEANKILTRMNNKAILIISENKNSLNKIAQELLEQEVISDKIIEKCLEGQENTYSLN